MLARLGQSAAVWHHPVKNPSARRCQLCFLWGSAAEEGLGEAESGAKCFAVSQPAQVTQVVGGEEVVVTVGTDTHHHHLLLLLRETWPSRDPCGLLLSRSNERVGTKSPSRAWGGGGEGMDP